MNSRIYTLKNIPLSCNSLLAVVCPSSSLVLRRFDFVSQTPVSRAFRQDFKSSYQNATSGSIVQCSNLHAHQRVGSCDVKQDSRSGGCEFDLPNPLFLCPGSHFTRQIYSCTLWTAACVISLATADDLVYYKNHHKRWKKDKKWRPYYIVMDKTCLISYKNVNKLVQSWRLTLNTPTCRHWKMWIFWNSEAFT